jgi:hypothetical protein
VLASLVAAGKLESDFDVSNADASDCRHDATSCRALREQWRPQRSTDTLIVMDGPDYTPRLDLLPSPSTGTPSPGAAKNLLSLGQVRDSLISQRPQLGPRCSIARAYMRLCSFLGLRAIYICTLVCCLVVRSGAESQNEYTGSTDNTNFGHTANLRHCRLIPLCTLATHMWLAVYCTVFLWRTRVSAPTIVPSDHFHSSYSNLGK